MYFLDEIINYLDQEAFGIWNVESIFGCILLFQFKFRNFYRN
jgi:hypothetical protein